MTTTELPDIQTSDKSSDKARDLAPAPEAPENFAGNAEVAARVKRVVQDIMVLTRGYMTPLWNRWRLTYHMLAGNTIDRAGPMEVHVPEVYKMVETIVPRAMENLMDRDPWFRLKPTKEEDEEFVDGVAALQDWQTKQAEIKEHSEEAFRDLLITQACAFLVDWKDQRRKVTRQLRDKSGKIIDTVTKEEKVYVGPTATLLDPFDFIIDPRCTDEQKGLYVGHRRMMTLEQIKQLPFLRDDKNDLTPHAAAALKRLEEQSGHRADARRVGADVDYYKTERSPTERSFRSPSIPASASSPAQYELVQLALPLDLLGNGVYEECRVVVCSSEVLLATRNFYTYQHRPYITARAAKNGHNFYGIGPLDNAIRLNQMYDRYHAIFMRLAEMTASPFWWVENEGSDVPTSLYTARPGKVMFGAGKVTQMQTSTEGLRAGPMVMGLMSRNIEETVGAFKIQMGQDTTGNTATSDTIALQEGNRRLRSLIANFAGVLTKWLRIGWKLNAQYLSEPDTFPVIGKRSKELNTKVLTVGPDSFLNEPYYEIIGIDALQNYGVRASQLAQALQITMPLLIRHAGNRFDDLEALNEYFALTLDQPTADRIIKTRKSRETLWSQDEENYKLRRGEQVSVSPDDPHQMHLDDMRKDMDRLMHEHAHGKVNPTEWVAFAAHASKHVEYLQRQAEEKAMQQQIMPPQPPEAGATPPADGQGQPSPAAGGFAAMLNPGGETPGPQSARTAGVSGRDASPLSQMQGALQ